MTIFILAELSLQAMINTLAFLNGGRSCKNNSTLWKFLHNVQCFIYSRELGKEPQYKYALSILQKTLSIMQLIYSQNKNVIKANKMFSNSIYHINMHLNRDRPLSWTLLHIHTIQSYKCIQSVFKAARVYTLHLHTHSLSGSSLADSLTLFMYKGAQSRQVASEEMTFHCAGWQLRHAAQAPSALSSCAERAGITQPISHRPARISREDRIKGLFRAGPIQTGPQITFKKGPIGQAQNPDHISHSWSGELRSKTSYLRDQKECV